MLIQHNVPFFANPDDTHCFQACIKMMFAYFEPEKEFSFDYLDKLSGKKKVCGRGQLKCIWN